MARTAAHTPAQNLAALCDSVSDQYVRDKTAVSGDVFALLAQKLLAAEIQPGGPYKDESGAITVRVNAAIGRLFILMGTPLPKVAAFIAGADLAVLTTDDREALARYTQTKQTVQQVVAPLRAKPYELAHARLMRTSEPLRSQALAFLKRVAAADSTGEIAGIATYTAQALAIGVPQRTLDTLGEANIYGWIAYMIYDHIIDGETSPALLSVANVAMRLSLSRYKEVVPHKHPMQRVIAQYFDDIDEANAWELETCRFTVQSGLITIGTLPNYKRHDVLARRSGIHILGPLIVAHISPVPFTPHTITRLTQGLREYLIARQLSDDIHDWKEDLAAGHISAVVTELLAQSTDLSKTHNIAQLTNTLQHDFFLRTMEDICKIIANHTKQATIQLERAGCVSGQLTGLVARIAQMTESSLVQRQKFLEFNKNYQLHAQA